MSPARQLAATRPSGTGRHVRVTPPITPPPPPPPTDPLAPVITSGPTVSSITDTTVSIRWDLDQPATGFIEYGTTTSYGTESAHETSFNWSYHIQSLSGLSSATTYHFRVRSTNSLGLEVISADTTFTTSGAPAPPPTPGNAGVYGTFFSTGVGNYRLWQGAYGTFRFRAETDSYLQSIRWYETTGAGYSAGSTGDMGNIVFSLRADDGTTLHNPSSTVLSSCAVYHGTSAGGGGILSTFTVPYRVTAGQLYHIQFENTHSDSVNHHDSVNCLVQVPNNDPADPYPDVSPGEPNPRWGPGALEMGAPNYVGGWATEAGISQRQAYWPIMDLTFSDGHHQGQGYMQLEDAFNFTGNTQVRQKMTISGGDKTVTGVILMLEHKAGTGTSPAVAYLENSSNQVMDSVTFPASDWPDGPATRGVNPNPFQVERPFAHSNLLVDGQTYYLRLATASGTTYMTEAIQNGVSYGYHPSLSFPDGVRQTTTGGAGGSWTTQVVTDMQFYMRVGTTTPPPPPPPPPPPTAGVSNVVISSVTDTGFAVDWDVVPDSYGRLQWATTTLANPSTNGTLTAEQVAPLPHHHMVVAGATASTLIHFRIWTASNGTGTADATQMTSATPAPPPPTQTGSALVYGTVHSNGTGNIRLWDDSPWCSYRWRAPFTKYVRSVRWYHVWDVPGQYSLGDPTAIITLNPDNPASTKFLNFNNQNVVATNQPVHTTVLSSTAGFSPHTSYFLGPQGNGNAGSVNDFITPYQVTAGQLYHIKFINTSSDTHNNNFSTDMTVNEGRRLSAKWGAGNLDMGIVHNGEVDSGIAHRPGYLPTFDISFSDTSSGSITGHWGDGYIYLEDPMTISGNTQVRERFTVSGGDKTVVSVIPNLYRVSGTSPLIVTLENASGGIIAQVSFPYTDFATFNPPYRACRPIWVERNFSAQQTITNGTTYSLRFSTASGTTYEMVEYEKGNGSGYGYHPSVSFGDGHVQTTTGGASGSWSDGGAHLVSDAQWFMRLA